MADTLKEDVDLETKSEGQLATALNNALYELGNLVDLQKRQKEAVVETDALVDRTQSRLILIRQHLRYRMEENERGNVYGEQRE